jgi:hypothetical protein
MRTIPRLIGCFVAVLALSVGISGRLSAQGFGSINGTVTDASGAVVPDAQVTAIQVGTGISSTTTTGSQGNFVFPILAPSVYNITAMRSGFEAYTEKGVALRADNAVTVNITLKPGTTTETVTVSADAAQVDVTTGTQQQVIGTASVNELPLNGRNAAALTEEVAGITIAPNGQADQGNTKTFPDAVTIATNGTFVGQTNYMLDGGNNVDEYTNVNEPFPMPDALQEFSVETSNYSAEYGQNAGGVVNIITKHGTNQYHGDAFEFVRNRDFNAANAFTYNAALGHKIVDTINRNQFGGTVGGPLEIPHLFQSDRSFGFFGYQRTINHSASTAGSSTILLPTVAQAGASSSGGAPGTNNLVFTDCVSNPFDPNGTTYMVADASCTNQSPYATSHTWKPGALSPVTANFMKYVPALTASGTPPPFQLPNNFDLAEITARADQELGAKDKLTERYFSDAFILQGVENLTNILSLSDEATNHYYNSLISETHTFNEHIVNNLIVSYQLQNDFRGPAASGIDVLDLGVDSANFFNPTPKQINQIYVEGGYFEITTLAQATFRRANYTLTDDIHFLMGRHNIDAGYHDELSKIDVNNLNTLPGQFNFSSTGTNDAMASFLFGYLFQMNQGTGQIFRPRGTFQGTYVQDSWKATRNLTLNYGVRYEPFVAWRERDGRMGSFSPTLWASDTHSTKFPLAPAGMEFAGDPGFNPRGVASNYNHWMPRLGFAYDVFGDGKTAIRGGAGLFFDSRINSTLFNIYSNGEPFLESVALSSTFSATTPANNVNMTWYNPYGTAGVTNPFPAPQVPPNTYPISSSNNWLTYDPYRGFQDPRTVAFNLAVEQQLTSSLLLRTVYVGEVSRHEWQDLELNPPIAPGSAVLTFDPAGCAATNSCYPKYITAANTGGNTNYNALQVSAEQRVKYGLTMLFNYTWSKSMDNMPWNQAATSIGAQNSFAYPITMSNFKALDYGPTEFDHTDVIAASYVYTEPKIMQNAPGGLRYLVNGFETTGLIQRRTGDPLTIFSSAANNSGSLQNRDRAVYSGSAAYGGTACTTTVNCRNYLNPAAFSVNPVGTFGNVQKGTFRGPGYADWDVSAARNFPFSERTALQFRAEYFNVLNHTNLGDPGTTLGGSFGKITSTSPQLWTATQPQNDPRIAQFSLKLLF